MYESVMVQIRNLQEIPDLFKLDRLDDFLWHLQIMHQNPDFAWYNVATIAFDPWIRQKQVKTVRTLMHWGLDEVKTTNHDLSILVPYIDFDAKKLFFGMEDVYCICDFGVDASLDRDEISPIQEAVLASGFSEIEATLQEGWQENLMESWMNRDEYYCSTDDAQRDFLRNCFLISYANILKIKAEITTQDLVLEGTVDEMELYKAVHRIITGFPGLFTAWVARIRKKNQESDCNRLALTALQAIRRGVA